MTELCAAHRPLGCTYDDNKLYPANGRIAFGEGAVTKMCSRPALVRVRAASDAHKMSGGAAFESEPPRRTLSSKIGGDKFADLPRGSLCESAPNTIVFRMRRLFIRNDHAPRHFAY